MNFILREQREEGNALLGDRYIQDPPLRLLGLYKAVLSVITEGLLQKKMFKHICVGANVHVIGSLQKS